MERIVALFIQTKIRLILPEFCRKKS